MNSHWGTLLREALEVCVRRGDKKEKKRAKLMVLTVQRVMRQRVGERGRKSSGRVRARMERRGREMKEWQAKKAACVVA